MQVIMYILATVGIISIIRDVVDKFQNCTGAKEFKKFKIDKMQQVADDLLESGVISYQKYVMSDLKTIAKIADDNKL